MTSPAPSDIAESLKSIGITGAGNAAQAWRTELQANTSIATHLTAIAAAVQVAKRRAQTALDNYTATAPTAAEIDAAQQELLAASREDTLNDPSRLSRATDKLGELLARAQDAADRYQQDTDSLLGDLDSDQREADDELSPLARARLQQMLSALANPAAPQGAAPPAGSAPYAPAPGGYGAPSTSSSPHQSGHVSGPESPGSAGHAVVSELAGSSTPATIVPTMTGVGAATAVNDSIPIAVAAQPTTASEGAGGVMPPMAPGMAGMGSGASGSASRNKPKDAATKTSDRDELLNGDDLLRRSVQGRL